MATKKTLHEVLAYAYTLNNSDREYVERYMRASRVVGLDICPKSLLRTSDADLRQLWDGGKIAEAQS